MRVILAEDHALVRAGIRALLDGLPNVSVVAEAGDGREAMQLAREHSPDVVLMDISMPLMNGLEAAERMRKEFPEIKVIIVSMHANEEYVWHALRTGAAGYLLKGANASELEVALAAVARGETYLSPSVSKVLADYIHHVGPEPTSLGRLTPRQREVLQLIAEGQTNREIATLLGISIKTVETHRSQLMETLDIHDVAGLVRFALRVGLIAPA
jgi:DNA-binding NarL/FixJ family response regulator